METAASGVWVGWDYRSSPKARAQRLNSQEHSWLPRHPAGGGDMSSQGFAESGGSKSSAPRDAPEARQAGLEGAKGKTKKLVKRL